jgi:hypothetical protein
MKRREFRRLLGSSAFPTYSPTSSRHLGLVARLHSCVWRDNSFRVVVCGIAIT